MMFLPFTLISNSYSHEVIKNVKGDVFIVSEHNIMLLVFALIATAFSAFFVFYLSIGVDSKHMP